MTQALAEAPAPAWALRLARAWLVLLWLHYVALYAGNMWIVDSVRDLVAALALSRDGVWPAQGPEIFSSFVLGPLWFHLLAMLLTITDSILMVGLLVGALAGLKIPLAFYLGRRFGSLATGVFAATWIALPTLSYIEHWTVSHTNLVLLTHLLVMTSALRLQDGLSTFRLALASTSLVLAIQAHPTNALAALWLLPALWRHRQARRPWARFLPAVLIFALALAPSILHDLDAARLAGTAQRIDVIDLLARIWDLLRFVLLDPASVLASLCDAPWMRPFYALFALIFLGSALRSPRTHRPAVGALLVVLCGAMALGLSRATNAIWMVLCLWPAVVVMLALGLRAFEQRAALWGRVALTLSLLLALSVQIAWSVQRYTAITSGVHPVGILHIIDPARSEHEEATPRTLLSSWALDRQTRRMCQRGLRASVFGDWTYGLHLVDGVAAEIHRCEASLQLGGQQWPRIAGMVAASGFQQDAEFHRVPGITLLAVREVLHPVTGRALNQRPTYPPVQWMGRERVDLSFDVALDRTSALAISTSYRFEPETRVMLTPAEGLVALPATPNSQLYACNLDHCLARVSISTVMPETVQVFTLERPRAPTPR